jgi:hypothetical protein
MLVKVQAITRPVGFGPRRAFWSGLEGASRAAGAREASHHGVAGATHPCPESFFNDRRIGDR